MMILTKKKPESGMLMKIGFLICLAALVLISGCGDSADTATSTGTTSTTATTSNAQDRAARLAAESQLRNAQMAQEEYYVENERYAATTAELKSIDTRLNPKVEVISGSAKGYEMKITANDSSQTVLIIRQTGSRIERVDGEGNSW
ncbi:MAG: type IV pilin protein [Thermoleophilia bacterium]